MKPHTHPSSAPAAATAVPAAQPDRRPDVFAAGLSAARAFQNLCRAERELLGRVYAHPAKLLPIARNAGIQADLFFGDDHRAIWKAAEYALAKGAIGGLGDIINDRIALAPYVRKGLEAIHMWDDTATAMATGSRWSEQTVMVQLFGAGEPDVVATHEAAHEMLRQARELTPQFFRNGPSLRRLADVSPEPVTWLWHGRIALGKLTILAGDPGLGKSTLTLDLAARVSSGRGMPDDEPGDEALPPAGDVLLVNCEDDAADTIRPRLDLAGADCRRVHLLEGRRVWNEEEGVARLVPFDLSDIATLKAAAEALPSLRLIVIDPVSAFVGRADSHNNAEVRGLLAPLSTLAARHKVAIVLVTHLSKGGGPGGGGTSAVYRPMGSLGFVAAARAVFSVTRDKSDPELRLMLTVKNNLAPDQTGKAYRLTAGGIEWRPGVVEMSADEATGGGAGNDEPDALEEAVQWLRSEMANGPVAAKEVQARAELDGISLKTLSRAKKKLRIESGREGGTAAQGRWAWFYREQRPKSASELVTPVQLAILGVSNECHGG